MALDALRDTLPAYAKDLSLNLSSLASETVLTDQQKWGAFLAAAHAVGQPVVIRAIENAAAEAGLSPCTWSRTRSTGPCRRGCG
jgi:alkyl hydroperoxide reductase subunit D